MSSDSTNALNLVRSDGNAKTSSANEEGTVDLAVGDELGGGSSTDGIGSLVACFAGTDVDDFSYAGV